MESAMTSRITRCGLFLALMALAAQLGWNARVPDMARMELAALLGDTGAICHFSSDDGGRKSPEMPGQNCPMCPCCIGMTLSVALVVPIVSLPPPVAIPPARFAATPPATGPPSSVRFAIARPRGPPTQA